MNRLYSLILSLNVNTDVEAFRILDQVGDSVDMVRINAQLLLPYGRRFLEQVANRGYKIFLDLRLADTPLEVARAILSLSGQAIHFFSLQLLPGLPMLTFAEKARVQAFPDCQWVGIHALYHLQHTQGVPKFFEDIGKNLLWGSCRLAKRAKIHNLLCTPYEFQALQKRFSSDFTYLLYGCEDYRKQLLYPFFKLAKQGAYLFVVDASMLKENPQYLSSLQHEIDPAFV